MLTAAQRRAQGHGNVRFRQIDLSAPIDQPAASSTACCAAGATCCSTTPSRAPRDAADPQAGRQRSRSPPGRGPDDNLWSAAPIRILPERGLVEPHAAGPRPVRLGRPERHRRDDGGGRVHRARDRGRRLHDALRGRRRLVGRADPDVHPHGGEADKTLDFATRSDVLAELEKAAEAVHAARRRRLHIPARTWIASGDRLSIAAHVLRRRRGSGPAEGQDRGHPGLRLPGPRPRP